MIDLFMASVEEVVAEAAPADWVARWIAIAGILVSVWNLVAGSRSQLWARRQAAVEHLDLKTTVSEVHQSLMAAQRDPRNMAELWVTTFNVHLQSLTTEVAEIPDKKLCLALRTLKSQAVEARGTQPTSKWSDESQHAITPAQAQALDRACNKAAEVADRIREIAKKGRAG